MTSPSNDRLPPKSRWWLARRCTLLGAGALFLASNVAGVVYFSTGTSAQQPHPGEPTAASARTANDRLLETRGCQSAVHLYQSYLNIGLIADAVEHETCTHADGLKMLNTVAALMDVVDRQFDRLNRSDLPPADPWSRLGEVLSH
jgi:hypothetical protein